MPATPEPRIEMIWPLHVRLVETAMTFLVWGVVLWIAVGCAFQFWLLPDWPPPRRGALAAGLAAPFAIWAACRCYFGRYFAVILHPEWIELRRQGSSDEIPSDDVLALIGRGGINLDGGELIAWKSLVIFTGDRSYTLAFNREVNASLYRTFREFCPGAWGLPFAGRLEPPEESGPLSGAGLDRLRRYYRGQVTRTFVAGLLVAVASAAALALTVRFLGMKTLETKGAIWLIVFPVIGVELLVRAFREVRVLRQVKQAELGAEPEDS